jgi:hypothetical protein
VINFLSDKVQHRSEEKNFGLKRGLTGFKNFLGLGANVGKSSKAKREDEYFYGWGFYFTFSHQKLINQQLL